MFSTKVMLKYSDAIQNATGLMLEKFPHAFVIGLGVSQGAGGTTARLKNKFPTQIIDAPTSEAAFTGMAVGAAISGLRPIIHHDRVEFSLVAADQIFTQASKWNYMFGGGNPVPLTMRIVVGRQWGNGPQHSQALYSLFGNVIGLKVVIPSSPFMAKGLLISAMNENCPVVLLEPRWLYGTTELVPEGIYSIPLDKAVVRKKGSDITVVTYGDGVLTALQAQDLLGAAIDLEIIDLVSINPIDFDAVHQSIKKTKRLICLDLTNDSFNIGSEIIANVATCLEGVLDRRPYKISCPNVPCPTATSLSEHYYPNKLSVANELLSIFGLPKLDLKLSFGELHLPPAYVFDGILYDQSS